MKDDLDKLTHKRGTLRTLTSKLITRIENTLSESEVTLELLEELKAQISEKQLNLRKLDSEVEALLTTDLIEKEIEASESYQEKIIACSSKISSRIKYILRSEEKKSGVNETKTEQILAVTGEHKIRLPKLTIDKFSGDSSSWLSFWSQYENAIHNNKDLTAIDKFNYLHSLVSGTASNAISGFSLTRDNYTEAVELLKARFGRKDLVINAHISKLLNLEPVKNSNNTFALRRLYDSIEIQIRNLNSLEVTSGTYGTLLTPILLRLIPNELNLEFNRMRKSKENFDVKELIDFLRQEVECRETANQIQNKMQIQNSAQHFKEKERSHVNYPTESKVNSYWRRDNESSPKQKFLTEEYKKANKNVFTATDLLTVEKKERNNLCIFCSESSHESSKCKFVYSLPLQKRKEILMEKGYCFRCIRRANHLSKTCRARIVCKFCSKNHSDILCYAHENKISENKSLNSNMLNDDVGNSVLANNSFSKQVFLQTLIVCINVNGLDYYVRILLDSGSVKSYISKFLAAVLKLECLGEETIVHGLFGGIEKKEDHKKYRINISNIDKSFSCELDVMDQEKICVSIPKISSSGIVNKVKQSGILVSDISINENTCMYEKDPNEIHMLIGADFAGRLFTGKIQQITEGLVAMHTRLGWTLMGESGEKTRGCETLLSLHISDLNIPELWQLDTIGIRDSGENQSKKELEEAAKLHFLQNVKRDQEGRYVVNLPWIKDHPPLTSCKKIAEKRLVNCVKSLEKIGKLRDYEEVFNEWVKEDIIEKVESCQETVAEHYLPHRPVFKENSTTKIRPVFDGSAKEKNCPSINECLEKGPNLIELIPSIINRFRFGKFGVIADIRKAFLQIKFQEHDRPFLRFLWREKGKDENLTVYQHKRVVFGISSSPFLLGATLEFHLKNVPDHYKATAQTLLKSFYVDNLVCSVNSKEELNKLIVESQAILREGKFELRGWEHTPTTCKQLTENPKIVPVLGLNWRLNEDTLTIDLKPFPEEEPIVTKRKILSAVHRIFDPIGFTCPVTLLPKILLQECWKNKVTWDAELPDQMKKKFERWKKELLNLTKLEIPRCLLTDSQQVTDLTLHAFCDASKSAYATCVFLRCQTDKGTTCQLIQARSRVAPVKQISIPRLELLACSIGARLVNTVKTDMNLEGVPTTYWTDSMNALCWITKNDNWATFVYNRVQEIRKLTKAEDWRHIAGPLNPADLPSRGCSAEELLKSRWWEGPSWLKVSPNEWPISKIDPDLEIVNSEKRKAIVSAANAETDSIQYATRISSYRKIIRVMAWIQRFCHNCKIKENRIKGKLDLDEINRAEKTILRKVQEQSFQEERKLNLQTFTDNDGLIKLKTRISMRKDLEAFRFPIVLPSKHHIVKKLIFEKHIDLCHSGLQVLMSTLRENFWIIRSRKTIRQVIRGCVKCKRFETLPLENISAPLPNDRVRDALVFEVTGIDLCGPLHLKNGSKCWIVIFTCAVYRATHLELVTSLSTDNFLLALRRFISRRGRPSTIYSDNGTNLVGTANELKSVDWEQIEEFATLKKISWRLNPPSAPWWGGFWERLIGMLKRILRKVIGNAYLEYEELNTILCDAESVINSRPLTYLSEDSEDLVALSPSLFLQEITEVGVPDLDLIDEKKLNKRYTYKQKIRQDLRLRFRSEYLGQLKDFSKTRRECFIKEGEIVLIGDSNTKKIKWPLAKVVKTFPGKDGRIRVVELKTKNGTFIRPIQRLYPLEIGGTESFPRPDLTPQLPSPAVGEDDEALCKEDPLVPDCERDPNLFREPEIRRSRYGRALKNPDKLTL